MHSKTKPVLAKSIETTPDALVLVMESGPVSIPWEKCSELLARASPVERARAKLSPSGYGIHWPLIDEDLAVGPLLEGNRAKTVTTTPSDIELSLFRDSSGPFTALLREGGIPFTPRTPRVGVMNSGYDLEIHSRDTPALATVICAFLKNRRSRKVIITTRDNTVIHAQGLSQPELERVIAQAKNLTVIETERDEAVPAAREPNA